MKPTDSNDDLSPIREALQRDAARAGEEPFSAELHYATVRRIRALSTTGRKHTGWRWIAAASACAAVLMLGFLVVPHPGPPAPAVVGRDHAALPTIDSARASVWAYQSAARESDEALLAMLDRDARVLLPPTASAFSSPLH